MTQTRRGFLRILSKLAVLAGVSRPLRAMGGPAPAAVEPGDYAGALARALQGQGWTETAAVVLEVPALAENGAIVPITVESRLPETRQILVFAERNPGPLLARFRFEPGMDGWVSLRVKLNESGPVLAIAEVGGKFYGARKTVRVMVGGCG